MTDPNFTFCHTAPASPPADFHGHSLSSTSIRISWGDVPNHLVNGILLGFYVLCKRSNSSVRHFVDVASEKRKWEFKGLQKFTNYSCCLRAYNNFGNGSWSKELVISTDEDGMLKVGSRRQKFENNN